MTSGTSIAGTAATKLSAAGGGGGGGIDASTVPRAGGAGGNSGTTGKATALTSVVTGVERVATVILHLWQRNPLQQVLVPLNGGIGLALYQDNGRLDSLAALEVADGRLIYFDAVRNPEKLVRAKAQLRASIAPEPNG